MIAGLYRFVGMLIVVIGLVTLAGCVPGADEAPGVFETPTISSYFSPLTTLTPSAWAEAGTPTVALYFQSGTATPQPTGAQQAPSPSPEALTPTLAVTPAETPTPAAAELPEVIIYGDELAPGWSLEHSVNMAYDLADPQYVHSGASSLSVIPRADYATLFFTLRQDAGQSYPYERVVGIRFWLSGGDVEIAPEDLAVTVIGSDAYTYYVPDDRSVDTEGEGIFSETRLYDLGVNRLIPADTWVEISVTLDELLFDPSYSHVTGIYIKNDAGFAQTFYVDDVALILTGE